MDSQQSEIDETTGVICSICRRKLEEDDDGCTIWHEHACE
jgi:hypothetical protein